MKYRNRTGAVIRIGNPVAIVIPASGTSADFPADVIERHRRAIDRYVRNREIEVAVAKPVVKPARRRRQAVQSEVTQHDSEV